MSSKGKVKKWVVEHSKSMDGFGAVKYCYGMDGFGEVVWRFGEVEQRQSLVERCDGKAR
jgi:hypothetical protein